MMNDRPTTAFRQRLLDRVAAIVHRTSMFGTTSAEISLAMWLTLSDLFVLDDREGEWSRASAALEGRYGPAGPQSVASWFHSDLQEPYGPAEVASIYAEFARQHGYFTVGATVDAASMQSILAIAEQCATTDMDQAAAGHELPEPSVIVGRKVYCFVPTDQTQRWVYFDFRESGDSMTLRCARVPASPARDGLIPTPSGARDLAIDV